MGFTTAGCSLTFSGWSHIHSQNREENCLLAQYSSFSTLNIVQDPDHEMMSPTLRVNLSISINETIRNRRDHR